MPGEEEAPKDIVDAGESHIHSDMDLIEAAGAELLALAVRIETPYFKARVLKLAASAYEMVNIGAAAFEGKIAYLDDDDEDDE